MIDVALGAPIPVEFVAAMGLLVIVMILLGLLALAITLYIIGKAVVATSGFDRDDSPGGDGP